jgi:CheY-like chemotaxis protein
MLILVVDDEPAVREAVERALRLDGDDVVLAGDGGEALVTLDERPPDSAADGSVAGVGLEFLVIDANGRIRCDYQFIES